jgi:hypothetical protein
VSAQQEHARRNLAARALVAETGSADLLAFVERADMDQMTVCGYRELTSEWAQQIRAALPDDFDFGCGCATCTITRGLNALIAENDTLADRKDLALHAAAGALQTLPRAAQSRRRAAVLRQVREALGSRT